MTTRSAILLSARTVTLSFAAAALLAGCGDKLPKLGEGKKGPSFRTAPIARTDIVRTVEATGTVQPRNSAKGIPVGAQVNGKLVKLFVDYNSVVTNGQVVALIDPLVYEANYRSACAQLRANEATVKVREATVRSCEAKIRSGEAAFALAAKTHARKQALVEKSLAPVADLDAAVEARDKAAAALDDAKAALDNAKASLESAKASVEQSRASADKARADLRYCTIVSPVDGVVIDRKVEEGETVVSSMNAVLVLTIAEDLRTIWVAATVPEADVGNIRVGQEVTFTADAYRRRFKGKVKQIRRAATTTNNVVTYPVIIEAENPDEMLFPGMTATLSIETARADNAVAVSAAAFRFRPKDEDRAPGEVPRGRKLWFANAAGKLEPTVVETGVSDEAFTQLVNGDAFEGRAVVIGYETARTAAAPGGKTENPFMPKRPKFGTAGTAPEPKKGAK